MLQQIPLIELKSNSSNSVEDDLDRRHSQGQGRDKSNRGLILTRSSSMASNSQEDQRHKRGSHDVIDGERPSRQPRRSDQILTLSPPPRLTFTIQQHQQKDWIAQRQLAAKQARLGGRKATKSPQVDLYKCPYLFAAAAGSRRKSFERPLC